MDDSTSLASLFIGSLLSATLLPGGSELLLLAILHQQPNLLWSALLIATLGNTLGSLITFGMGWLLPHKHEIKYETQLKRYGVPLLLFAWVPIVGDALCLAAGWLRLQPLGALCCITIGKFVRYGIVAWAII